MRQTRRTRTSPSVTGRRLPKRMWAYVVAGVLALIAITCAAWPAPGPDTSGESLRASQVLDIAHRNGFVTERSDPAAPTASLDYGVESGVRVKVRLFRSSEGADLVADKAEDSFIKTTCIRRLRHSGSLEPELAAPSPNMTAAPIVAPVGRELAKRCSRLDVRRELCPRHQCRETVVCNAVIGTSGRNRARHADLLEEADSDARRQLTKRCDGDELLSEQDLLDISRSGKLPYAVDFASAKGPPMVFVQARHRFADDVEFDTVIALAPTIRTALLRDEPAPNVDPDGFGDRPDWFLTRQEEDLQELRQTTNGRACNVFIRSSTDTPVPAEDWRSLRPPPFLADLTDGQFSRAPFRAANAAVDDLIEDLRSECGQD